MTPGQAHRLAQLRLGTRLIGQLHAAFRLLDPADLDGSFEDWLVVVEPQVQNTRRMSAQMATAYLTSTRLAAVGYDTTYIPRLAGPVNPAALRTSLMVTGPVSIKSAIGRKAANADTGHIVRRALDVAEARSSSAAMRHALNGGRETILETVRHDTRAVGWARVTSGKACAFCAMLASRGPVYDEDTASFDCHDGCSCSVEPAYSHNSPWPEGSARYREIWDSATNGAAIDSTDAINRFRGALAS